MYRNRYLKPEEFQDVFDSIDPELSEGEELDENDNEVISSMKSVEEFWPKMLEEMDEPLFSNISASSQINLSPVESVKEASRLHSSPVVEAASKKHSDRKKEKRNYKFKKINFERMELPCDGTKDNTDWEKMSPYEMFKHFIPDSVIQNIVLETKRYAMQKDGKEFEITAEDIEKFFGVLLIMAVVHMPNLKMYWADRYRYEKVAGTMSRNKFEAISKYIHFANNEEMKKKYEPGHDKCFKIRPLITAVRDKLRQIKTSEHSSVDEQVIPFKGRSTIKQYIKNKPHKWGIKVFTRAGANGIMHDFEIYTGGDTCPDYGLGFSANIVLHLCRDIPSNKNYKVFTDNWFSSISLATALRERGIFMVGTVRKDRMAGAQKLLEHEKSLKKRGRGSEDHITEMRTGVNFVRWYDRKEVNFISTYTSVEPKSTCQRWSACSNQKVAVARPNIVEEYNSFMGGVDLADMLLELYRVNRRCYKWYFRVLYWILGVVITNGWLLSRSNKKSLLEFHGECAEALLTANKSARKRGPGRPSTSPRNAEPPKARRRLLPVIDSRFDGFDHFPEFEEKRKRCAVCKNAAPLLKCSKCDIHLCLTPKANCFKVFHSK